MLNKNKNDSSVSFTHKKILFGRFLKKLSVSDSQISAGIEFQARPTVSARTAQMPETTISSDFSCSNEFTSLPTRSSLEKHDGIYLLKYWYPSEDTDEM